MSDAVAHSVARYSNRLKFIPRPEREEEARKAAKRSRTADSAYLGHHLSR